MVLCLCLILGVVILMSNIYVILDGKYDVIFGIALGCLISAIIVGLGIIAS